MPFIEKHKMHFARIVNKHLTIADNKKLEEPRSLKQLLWRIFVVRSELDKSKLIELRFVKKSCSAYEYLHSN